MCSVVAKGFLGLKAAMRRGAPDDVYSS